MVAYRIDIESRGKMVKQLEVILRVSRACVGLSFSSFEKLVLCFARFRMINLENAVKTFMSVLGCCTLAEVQQWFHWLLQGN